MLALQMTIVCYPNFKHWNLQVSALKSSGRFKSTNSDLQCLISQEEKLQDISRNNSHTETLGIHPFKNCSSAS